MTSVPGSKFTVRYFIGVVSPWQLQKKIDKNNSSHLYSTGIQRLLLLIVSCNSVRLLVQRYIVDDPNYLKMIQL